MNDTEKLIIDALKNNNTFVILPHINPDSDAMGSCYAMKRVLEKMGKSAVVYTQEKLPEYLLFLPGEYSVYENAEPYDVCLCIDCGDIGRIDTRAALLDVSQVSINIDHHYANTNYADINLVNADASSAGEICCGLINKVGMDIDSEIAMCLYSAICADTGGFRYSNTTPKSMRIAADLLEYGVDSAKINRLLFDTEKYDVLRLKGEISKSIELFCGGLVGVACLDKSTAESYGVNLNDIDNIVDIARRIEGVEVAASFKESDAGIKISLRSNEYIDVSKIAEKFGGGGHVRASGILMECDFETAKSRVIEEIITSLSATKNV